MRFGGLELGRHSVTRTEGIKHVYVALFGRRGVETRSAIGYSLPSLTMG